MSRRFRSTSAMGSRSMAKDPMTEAVTAAYDAMLSAKYEVPDEDLVALATMLLGTVKTKEEKASEAMDFFARFDVNLAEYY